MCLLLGPYHSFLKIPYQGSYSSNITDYPQIPIWTNTIQSSEEAELPQGLMGPVHELGGDRSRQHPPVTSSVPEKYLLCLLQPWHQGSREGRHSLLPPPLLKSVILIITSSYILILEMMQVLRHQPWQHAWIEKAESFAREQTKASTSPTLAKWPGGL